MQEIIGMLLTADDIVDLAVYFDALLHGGFERLGLADVNGCKSALAPGGIGELLSCSVSLVLPIFKVTPKQSIHWVQYAGVQTYFRPRINASAPCFIYMFAYRACKHRDNIKSNRNKIGPLVTSSG